MKTVRPLTPKEFSDAIGGVLCADTIRAKCKAGEIATVNGAGRPPYFIKPTELARWRPVLDRFLVAI